ncbi:hypothetical protein HUJ04_007299 [Dendroctonus ponderosae]|nr:hypothetical protein HUJ04_007299 [Dendroctonus ponderosae]
MIVRTEFIKHGICAIALTLPIDVVKTRMMNSKPGEFRGVIDCIRYTASLGTSALYRGFVPSAIRIAPMTVIVYICFDQLTRKFGYIVRYKNY